MGYSLRTDIYRYTLWVRFHAQNFSRGELEIGYSLLLFILKYKKKLVKLRNTVKFLYLFVYHFYLTLTIYSFNTFYNL